MSDKRRVADKLVLSFKEDGEVSAESLGSLTVEIASDRNSGKGTFGPTDTAIVDVYTYGEPISTAWSSFGSLSFLREELITKKEDLEFTNKSSAELQHKPAGAVSAVWLGRTTGKGVVVDGTKVSTTSPVLGVLRCEYATRVSVYKITGAQAPTLCYFATKLREGATRVPTPDDTTSTTNEKRDVQISVADYLSGEFLANVLVEIDGPTGYHSAVTDSEGVVLFAKLQVNGHYTLKMSAEGYIPSDQDALLNDGFTVPKEE